MSAIQRPRRATLPLFVGFVAIVSMIGVMGVWSFSTEIDGAIVAQGAMQVDSDQQVIQHPDGGVVSEILVREGDFASVGDVLVRFDGTYLTSELAVVEGQLSEIFARRCRLVAERDTAGKLVCGDWPDFETVSMQSLSSLITGQAKLFEARRTSLEQEWRQLDEQQMQVRQQIEGTEAQLISLLRQLELIDDEMSDVAKLFESGLVKRRRLLDLNREDVRLQGEIGNLNSQIAEARSRIASLKIEQLRLLERRREDAIVRLRDLNYSAIEFEERRIRLSAQISKLEVRAPVAGIVFDTRVLALQSVVRPAEAMMYIVPPERPLQVSARILPTDVDQIYAGQPATMIFSAFNRRTTPDVSGTVLRVSPDIQWDDASGASFYQATVVLDEEAVGSTEQLTFLPGMPVEVFLRTGKRTPISYLTEPVAHYFKRAFREE